MYVSSLASTPTSEIYNKSKTTTKIEDSKKSSEIISKQADSRAEKTDNVSVYTPNELLTGEAMIRSNPNIDSSKSDKPKIADDKSTKKDDKPATKSDSEKQSPMNLSDEEKAEVDKLKSRDAEVRAHEQAHISAGGSYVRGGASFSTQKGPDGKEYAVGGEVSIDTSAEKDPSATLRKARVIQSAAMAPASPSGQDRAVAAAAMKMAMEAMSQLAEQRKEGITTDKSSNQLVANDTAVNNKQTSNDNSANNQPSITKADPYDTKFTNKYSNNLANLTA